MLSRCVDTVSHAEDLAMNPPIMGYFLGFEGNESAATITFEEALSPLTAMCVAANKAFPVDPQDWLTNFDLCKEFAEISVEKFQNSLRGELNERDFMMLALIASTNYHNLSSFYDALNYNLKTQHRQSLRPFVPSLWMLMWALKKCPVFEVEDSESEENIVYHEVKGKGISEKYRVDSTYPFSWVQFTSCVCDENLLTAGLGESGDRTIIQIKLTCKRARVISDFDPSGINMPKIVLIPPNSMFKVIEKIDLGNGLVKVCVEEVPSRDPILNYGIFEEIKAYVAPSITSLSMEPSITIRPKTAQIKKMNYPVLEVKWSTLLCIIFLSGQVFYSMLVVSDGGEEVFV